MTEPFDIEAFDEWIRSQAGFSAAVLHSCAPLGQDGSGRVFWRVWLDNVPQSPFVYIEHPLTGGPVFHGDTTIQAHAFVETASFFSRHSVPTPVIFASDRASGRILMEDIGDYPLASLARSPDGAIRESMEERCGSDWLQALFKEAIDIIIDVQEIPFDKRELPFRRYRSIDDLRAETGEFVEHYAMAKGLRTSAREELLAVFDALCEEMAAFPKTLSFFDYNTFNLFVQHDGERMIRILDFQDASLNSPARDIFSLLNDRGMDEVLGKERQHALLNYFIAEKGLEGADASTFMFRYYVTALQWDFKNVGRFHKLQKTLDTDRYVRWVAPTLRRLGRNLIINQNILPRFGNVIEIVTELAPEAKEGTQEDWRFCPVE